MEFQREVNFLAAQRQLDLASRSQVIDWATSRVAGGHTNADLAILAGLAGDDDRVDRILERLLVGLGYVPQSPYEAAMWCAAYVAGQLAEDHLQPIDAARKIWRIAVTVPQSEHELGPFIGLASEWEDDADSRPYYEDEICARALILAAWPEG
jgi:hypothetical protein